jgi:hypothetical protein
MAYDAEVLAVPTTYDLPESCLLQLSKQGKHFISKAHNPVRDINTYRQHKIRLQDFVQKMLLPSELMLGTFNIIMSMMSFYVDHWLGLELSDVRKADVLLSRSYLKHLAPTWWYDRESLPKAMWQLPKIYVD